MQGRYNHEDKIIAYQMKLKDDGYWLFQQMQHGDHAAFEALFYLYYRELCFFTEWHVRSKECAEELVSDLFIKLWEKRAVLQITNIRPYLYQAAKHNALNYLRKSKLVTEPIESHTHLQQSEAEGPYQQLLLKESHKEMNSLIDSLPERRKLIFVMSRIDGLSYSEIADLLDISIRTVEDQMFKAVKSLRSSMHDKKN